MASGFSYNGDTQVFIVNGASSFEVTSFFKTTEDNGILTVSCDNLKAIDGVTLDASSKVVVNYTAKLGTNAQIGCLGNKNEVYLEYSNDPTSAGEGTTAKTPKDQVIVFTYELDVTKVDGADSAKKLEGAEFKLCVKGTDLWAVVDENGYVTGWKNDKNLVPPLVSAADGTFKIIGLDDGEYQLKETKAPNGYNLLPDSVPLVIKGTTANGQNWNGSDETLTALTIKVGNSDVADGSVETGIVSAQIQNNKGATLPETGGVGTTMFYIVGALLVIGGGVFLVTRRRMKNEQ